MSHSNTLKIHSAILSHLERVGHNTVAEAMGVDGSTITHLKDRSNKVNFESLAVALDAMGLKVVPTEMKCYNPEDIQEILSMAKKYMQTVDMNKLEF